MKTQFALPLLALGLAAASAAPVAAQSSGTFSLPPNPTPTATPPVQGPVDRSGAVPQGPRVIPTGSPTVSPTPTPTLAPAPQPTRATPPPTPTVTRRTPSPTQPQSRPEARPQPQSQVPSQTQPPSGLPGPAASPATPADTGSPSFDLPDTTTPATTANSEAGPAETETDAETGASTLPDWWWIAAILVALAAIGAAVFFRRRKQANLVAPTIEAPIVAGYDGAIAADDLLRYLKVELEPVKMSRSMMASTLSYRLTLTNRAPGAMRTLSLDGDLTSAHGQAPISEQMADTLTALPDIHALEHLGPGQRKSFTGEMRLPLISVRPIRQGNVPIYVPLVRLKVSAAGAEPKAFTFVVGKRPAQPGGRLQPFRLDVPPQTYSEVDSRPLT